MKTKLSFLILLTLFFFLSCEKEKNEEKLSFTGTDNELTVVNEAIDLMAIAVAKSMNYAAFRELIKFETSKQFDYDYDILYRFIKNQELNIEGKGEITVSALLLGQIQDEISLSKNLDPDYFNTIEDHIPGLNICIPFQYKNWNPNDYIPKVASFPDDFDEKTHTRVKGFDTNGSLFWITSADADWELPVVTVGTSERVDEDGYLKVNAGSIVLEKEDRFMTADEAYKIASSSLKSGYVPDFDPLIEIKDDAFFNQKSTYVSTENIPDNNSFEKPEHNLKETLNLLDCTSPNPTKFVRMHPAIDFRGAVTFEWEDVLAKYYEIWRSEGSGDPGPYTTVGGTQTTFTNAQMNTGKTYNYKIRAKNASNSCYSAFTQVTSHDVGWRRAKDSEYLSKVYINKTCWKDISWGRSKIELYVKVVKYNFSNSTLEYPKFSMGQVSRDSQENKWRTYNKLMFMWDMTKYATNYWIYFYEEDGGNQVTIKLGSKLWVGNPTDSTVGVGGEVSVNVEFSVGGRDDGFGFLEVFNHTHTELTDGIDINPPKGSARVVINSH